MKLDPATLGAGEESTTLLGAWHATALSWRPQVVLFVNDRTLLVPLVADGARIPPEGRARVWRSGDAGESWTPSGRGLPDDFWAAVMRDAMTTDRGDQAGLYLGARDGSGGWLGVVEHRLRAMEAN